ncbi:MAG TPA: hypothetical protein VM934_11395 [Pyrinomonadaceae bacterium]|nr:hypothetical protein [Pyrinomonadaceae bacterium]
MKYIITLLLGVVLGGVAAYFLFVGAPRTNKMPGTPVGAPEAGGNPAGTAVLTLDEQFFNTLLSTIFGQLGEPTFRLGSNSPRLMPAERASGFDFVQAQAGGCQNQVVIAPEGGGVRTGVRLENGQVLAPLAFSGTYNLPFMGCTNFKGTAQANIQLRFEPQDQTLYGQLNVEGVNPEGVSPVLSGPITAFVQNAINQRVNPLVLMRGSQLNLNIPVQATGGTVRAQAKEVRSEVKDNALRLFVTYDFSGTKGAPQQPQQPTGAAPPG